MRGRHRQAWRVKSSTPLAIAASPSRILLLRAPMSTARARPARRPSDRKLRYGDRLLLSSGIGRGSTVRLPMCLPMPSTKPVGIIVVAVDRQITEADFLHLQFRRSGANKRLSELSVNRALSQAADKVSDLEICHLILPDHTLKLGPCWATVGCYHHDSTADRRHLLTVGRGGGVITDNGGTSRCAIASSKTA